MKKLAIPAIKFLAPIVLDMLSSCKPDHDRQAADMVRAIAATATRDLTLLVAQLREEIAVERAELKSVQAQTKVALNELQSVKEVLIASHLAIDLPDDDVPR